jgi:hypothetical protein
MWHTFACGMPGEPIQVGNTPPTSAQRSPEPSPSRSVGEIEWVEAHDSNHLPEALEMPGKLMGTFGLPEEEGM